MGNTTIQQRLEQTQQSREAGRDRLSPIPIRPRRGKTLDKATRLKICEIIARVADGFSFSAALDDSGLTPSQFFRALKAKRNAPLKDRFDEAKEISRMYYCERATDVLHASIGLPAAPQPAADGAPEQTGTPHSRGRPKPDGRGAGVEVKVSSDRLRAVIQFLSCEGRFSANGRAGGEDDADEVARALSQALRTFHERCGNKTDAVEE